MPQNERTSVMGLGGRGAVALGLSGALLAVLAGCTNQDSYMNPSIVGRWERTPTRVPILTHLAAIEDPQAAFVDVSEITPEDLQAQTDVYRVGPGDVLALTIWDLVARGSAEVIPRQIDQNGYIEIPQLGRIYVNGLTEPEVAEAVAKRMEGIVADPLVSVVVETRRQQLYFLVGNVAQPGPYIVPSADYRLTEALATAGWIPEFADEILITRQVSLSDSGLRPESPGDRFTPRDRDTGPGEDVLDVIEDLSSPGALGGAMGGVVPAVVQPAGEEPPIDLIDSGRTGGEPAQGNGEGQASAPETRELPVRWRYRGGKWVREAVPAATRNPILRGNESQPRDSRGDLFTQRVIRVPVKPLVAGDARYNIVIRPGDIVRVPPAELGNFYVGGQVNRPGVYSLPQVGKMTILRAMDTAGGLGQLAIPERVDLTRIVGPDEQATIMLDLRAIAEGTQPDVYLRRDDRINVGTSFWATPLAVFRGGFRTSYGFGFLLDRNFGNDVFGAPPVNRFGQ